MEHIQLTKLIEDGEYEGILRQISWQIPGSGEGCYMQLYFEILDGTPRPAGGPDWLVYTEDWPDPDSALDGWAKMAEGLGVPHRQKPFPRITSLPLGHRFKVCVHQGLQAGGGMALYYCKVTEILGLAEPSQYGTHTLQAKDLT